MTGPSSRSRRTRPPRPAPRRQRGPGRDRRSPAISRAPGGGGADERDEHQRANRLGRQRVVREQDPADRRGAYLATPVRGRDEVPSKGGVGGHGEEGRPSDPPGPTPTQPPRPRPP